MGSKPYSSVLIRCSFNVIFFVKMKFLLVLVVSLGLVQGIVQEYSEEIFETLSSPLHAKLVKEFGPAGNDKCENEKIVELSKGHTKCTQKNRLVEISKDYCTSLGETIDECLKPFN